MGRKIQIPEKQLETMRDFYLDNHTLEETAKAYDFTYGTLYNRFKIRGWLRGKKVKVKLRYVQSFDDSLLVEFKREWDKLDTTTKGTIAEGYVKIKLSELGFDVWEPTTQNHKTDFVILNAKIVLKIQVKSATYDLKSKSFRGNLSKHRRNGDHLNYSMDDVDYFIVYCGGLPSLEFYVIPADIVTDNRTPRFFPHRDKAMEFTDFSWEIYRNAFQLLEKAFGL